jgi:molybdopterin-biosynthesis enzyme MoeA-like protein
MILQLKSIARAFKVKYEFHKEAYKILEKYYGKIKFNDGRKKMAKMPKGSKLIYNPSSAAPGFITKKCFVSARSAINLKFND